MGLDLEIEEFSPARTPGLILRGLCTLELAETTLKGRNTAAAVLPGRSTVGRTFHVYKLHILNH